jgi:hypothetical protein
MRWIKRFKIRKDGTRSYTNPEKDDDYWVTDGYYVFKAHYNKESNSWGIYQPSKFNVIKYCYSVGDMNFDIIAYCNMGFPKNYTRFKDK